MGSLLFLTISILCSTILSFYVHIFNPHFYPCVCFVVFSIIPPGSRNALDECYSRLNVGGIASGNCGSSGTSYLPCGAEDVTCGQLHCELGILNQDLVGRSYTPVNVRLPVGSCHSFTHPATADTLSLGLVDDGTKCGNNSVRHWGGKGTYEKTFIIAIFGERARRYQFFFSWQCFLSGTTGHSNSQNGLFFTTTQEN